MLKDGRCLRADLEQYSAFHCTVEACPHGTVCRYADAYVYTTTQERTSFLSPLFRSGTLVHVPHRHIAPRLSDCIRLPPPWPLPRGLFISTPLPLIHNVVYTPSISRISAFHELPGACSLDDDDQALDAHPYAKDFRSAWRRQYPPLFACSSTRIR